jgi:hypothetical protein
LEQACPNPHIHQKSPKYQQEQEGTQKGRQHGPQSLAPVEAEGVLDGQESGPHGEQPSERDEYYACVRDEVQDGEHLG